LKVNSTQFEKVLAYLKAGPAEGAKLQCGGERCGTKGYFIQPTVFSDVTNNMNIARDEVSNLYLWDLRADWSTRGAFCTPNNRSNSMTEDGRAAAPASNRLPVHRNHIKHGKTNIAKPVFCYCESRVLCKLMEA
jgi:hypothetical protein